jgi:hypothetical protein
MDGVRPRSVSCPEGFGLEITRHGRGSAAAALSPDLPALGVAEDVLESLYDVRPLRVAMGATIPIGGIFRRTLGIDTVFFSFSTADEGFHGPNEFFRLNRFRDGLVAWARVLVQSAPAPAGPLDDGPSARQCLVLHDPALGGHPDQIQIVDREPGIAPDRGALEAGIRPVDLAAEHDVPVVSVKNNCAPSLRVIRQIAASRVVSSSRCARMAGVMSLGMGSHKGWRVERRKRVASVVSSPEGAGREWC